MTKTHRNRRTRCCWSWLKTRQDKTFIIIILQVQCVWQASEGKCKGELNRGPLFRFSFPLPLPFRLSLHEPHLPPPRLPSLWLELSSPKRNQPHANKKFRVTLSKLEDCSPLYERRMFILHLPRLPGKSLCLHFFLSKETQNCGVWQEKCFQKNLSATSPITQKKKRTSETTFL